MDMVAEWAVHRLAVCRSVVYRLAVCQWAVLDSKDPSESLEISKFSPDASQSKSHATGKQVDSRLAIIIEAWPALTTEQTQAILAIVAGKNG